MVGRGQTGPPQGIKSQWLERGKSQDNVWVTGISGASCNSACCKAAQDCCVRYAGSENWEREVLVLVLISNICKLVNQHVL